MNVEFYNITKGNGFPAVPIPIYYGGGAEDERGAGRGRSD